MMEIYYLYYVPSRESVKKRLGEGVGLHEASGWRGYRTEGDVIHMGARLYHYPTARFVSADPLGHASDMSLYSYANNDPVNGVDPSGRLTIILHGTYDKSAEWINVNSSLANELRSQGVNDVWDGVNAGEEFRWGGDNIWNSNNKDERVKAAQ
ncbi:MAG: hypothetical protein NZM04_10385, partial [Methylacidiphilales bacterium]|nr:hypothetical protein [Candidatus Methylacidiphilales bacterium]